MKPTLAGVDLRLDRADEHLALLYGQRTMLLEDKGDRVIGDFEAESGDYVFRVAGDPPPLHMAVTFGEFIHALRAALDNFAYQLIVRRANTPDLKPDFPIYEYVTSKKGHPYAEALRSQMPGLADEDYTFIEGRQPYQMRLHDPWKSFAEPTLKEMIEWHPLMVLREFDDADKHRLMTSAYAGVLVYVNHGGEWMPGLVGGRIMLTLGKLPGNFTRHYDAITSADGSVINAKSREFGVRHDDPTEVARVVGVEIAPGREPKMEMHPRTTLEVAFSYGERPLTVADLMDIRDYVRATVEHFRPLFG